MVSGAVLVDVDEERTMRLGRALADMAAELATDDVSVGVLLALAVAMHGQQAGLIGTEESRLNFAAGWGRMLGYAVMAVESDG